MIPARSSEWADHSTFGAESAPCGPDTPDWTAKPNLYDNMKTLQSIDTTDRVITIILLCIHIKANETIVKQI